MPGAPARPPGWRPRGCRRSPRTGRTARSRQPATRRPHPAGPVRSRYGGLLRPERRTGAWCFAGHGRCTRAGTARVVPPREAGRPGWSRTSPARPRQGGGAPRREGVVPRVQRRKLAHQFEDLSVARQPVEHHAAGGHGVLRGRPLPGRHITTVGQNHRSPGGLTDESAAQERREDTAPTAAVGITKRADASGGTGADGDAGVCPFLAVSEVDARLTRE